MRKSFIIIMLMFFTITSTFAQGGAPFIDFSPNFFIAVIAGVLLAMGFQAILTFLSVAVGINAAGPLNKRNHNDHHKDRSKHDDHDQEHHKIHDRDKDKNKTPTSVKISSAAGVWTLITASISLFFASWFGVKLSLLENDIIGMTLGLVIWAVFFLTMMYLEARALSSIAGGLYGLATNAFKSSFGAIKSAASVFQKSEESKVTELVDHSVDKIRHEIALRLDTDTVTEKLDQYVEKLRPEPIDYDRLEQELKHILNEMEIEHSVEPSEGKFDRKIFIRIAEESPNMSKEDVKKAGDMFDRVKSAASRGNTKTEKVAAVFDTVSPGSESDSARIRNKIAEYLRKTDAEEIQPEKLEHDLEEIINQPGSAKDVVMNRFNQLDRTTLIQLVKSSNDKIDDAKAHKIVETAESVLEKVKSTVSGTTESVKSKTSEKQGQFQGASDQVKQGAQSKKLEWEMKLREFFDSFNRPEYDYDRFKSDIVKLFKDPSLAPEMITLKLKDYDRETIKEVLSRNKYLDKKDIDKFINKFEDARDTIIRKYEEVEYKVREKIDSTKQAALDQAENARKTAAVAAWWVVGTAIVSAAASLFGGMLAI